MTEDSFIPDHASQSPVYLEVETVEVGRCIVIVVLCHSTHHTGGYLLEAL